MPMVRSSCRTFRPSSIAACLRPAGVEDFEALEKVGEHAWRLHDQPDAGLWELRTRQSVHTYSGGDVLGGL